LLDMMPLDLFVLD